MIDQSESPDGMEDVIAAATAQLDKLMPPQRRQDLKIRTAVRIGKPYQQIIQLALESQIDLVSMGVRGRGALDLAVFGSTTYRVMQLGSLPCFRRPQLTGKFRKQTPNANLGACIRHNFNRAKLGTRASSLGASSPQLNSRRPVGVTLQMQKRDDGPRPAT